MCLISQGHHSFWTKTISQIIDELNFCSNKQKLFASIYNVMYQLNKCCTLLLLAEAFSNEISLHGRSGHWHIWITKFSIYHIHVPKSTGESYKAWSCAQSTDMWWSVLFTISVAYTAICLSARVTQVQQATSAGTWKHGVAYKLLQLSLNDSISKKWQNLNENGSINFWGEKSSEFWKWTRLNFLFENVPILSDWNYDCNWEKHAVPPLIDTW